MALFPILLGKIQPNDAFLMHDGISVGNNQAVTVRQQKHMCQMSKTDHQLRDLSEESGRIHMSDAM